MTSPKSWISRRLTDGQKQRIKRWLVAPGRWHAERRERAVRRAIDGASGERPLAVRVDGALACLIESSYDAMAEVTWRLERVKSCLSKHGIEYVQLPHWRPYQPLLVVAQEKAPVTVTALEQLPRTEGWHVQVEGAPRTFSPKTWLRQRTPLALQVLRHLVAINGRSLSTEAETITIEFWKQLPGNVPRVDGEMHVPGTLHRQIKRRSHSGPFIEYVPPDLWQDAQDNNGILRWPKPHIYKVTDPVDIVYTWVDGADSAWRQRKNKAAGIIDENKYNPMAANAARYINRDELKYSLRSVEMYASWVRHIYIVTDRQVPEWLDTNHPKVTVVDHRDIFTNPSVLPVFNSHAIESQLHHIFGLSEHYLYMNDDLLFMRPVTPELFFTGSGLTRFFPSTAPLDMSPVSARDLPVLSAAKRGREFMQSEHSRTVTNKFKHTPMPQKKSVLIDMEAAYPDLFERAAASKFRHPDDYSIPSSLYHYHAYALGLAIPGDICYGYIDISRQNTYNRLTWLLNHHVLDVLCLNETDTPASAKERVDKAVTQFMEYKFPISSTFEIH